MSLPEASVRRPVAIFVTTIALVVFGALSVSNLRVELLPDLSYPTLTVQTVYPDAAPTSVEQFVTRPLEEALGVVPGVIPAVVYRSVAPDGTTWRVVASFVSDDGRTATSVSEVVWRWLEAPDTAWSLVERISPWSACELAPERCRAFDRALFTSLDLPQEYSF